ncbi:MAG: TRZ/ATZ family hydrolase [Gammaproteobacteria bacterium]
MESVDTLLHARWIAPVEPHATVWENASVALHQGRIRAIGPRAEIGTRYRSENEVDLPDHLLIPGLINAHTHAAMTLLRGYADDLPLMEWLTQHIWPAEQKWVNDEFVHDGSQHAVAEMLRGGTTCFNDMYFFPEVTARVASSAGIRACVGLILIDFPSAYGSGIDEYLEKGLALHDEYRNDALIRTAFAPHAPYTVSDAPLERVRVLADELEIPIHIHVHETADEVANSLREHGVRPLERLQRLGMVGPSLVGVHMTQLEEAEIGQLARANAHVVHCPESNLKLASGFCPVKRLLDAEVNVALGTDGTASNDDLDMLGEMRSAALLAKAVAGDASAVPAATVLRMATLNGARALGLDQETGSLEVGKAADIVAVRLDALETQPLYNPISQLVYAANRDCVTDVWVAGRHLLSDGQLTTLDEEAIVARSRQWAEKLAGRH